MNNTAWIQTKDGLQFFPQAPRPEQIDPQVICAVLSRLPRFGGHTITTYRVAQHSYLVYKLVEHHRHLRLPALLHDAHEVYTGFGDVCGTVKKMFPLLKMLEDGIDQAIAAHFGFDPELFNHPDIKEADMVLRATEKRDLMGPEPAPWSPMPEPLVTNIQPWSESISRNRFAFALKSLTGVAVV